MKIKRSTLLSLAFFAAFIAGLLIRFVALTRVPLSDSEASLALQALDLARGQPVQSPAQPGYLALTGLLFFLFGGSDFLARFWPSLAGSLLVLAPWLYRRYLGAGVAAVLAFFLALDPGLVAASRQVGSPILAVSFLILAGGFYLRRRAVLAGICAGLALLGGPQLWPGLLVAAVLVWRLSSGRWQSDPAEPTGEENHPVQPVTNFSWRKGLAALLATLVLVGAMFFRSPALLGGVPSSLVAYLSGWFSGSGVTIWLLLAAIVFYELFALLAGLAGLIRGLVRGEPVDRLLGLGLGLGLLLALLYPGRQVVDLIWPMLALNALAARLVVRWLNPRIDEISIPAALSEALLTVVLLIFAWMNLATLANPATEEATLRAAAMWSAVGLLLITSVLMVWGWSLLSMRTGLSIGLTILLALFTLAAAVNAAGLGRNPRAEMWQTSDMVVDEDLLTGTVGDLALHSKGFRQVIDVAMVGVNSPAMRWALRDVEQLSQVNYLPPEMQPSVVITPDQQTLNLSNAYRGQDFVWTDRPAWSLFLESDWLRWLLERESPGEKVSIILWARTDLFPGDNPQPAQP